MINVVTIDHVVLRTNQMTAMLNFYCALLGCVEERRLPEIGLVQLRAGSSLIDLIDVEAGKSQQENSPPRKEAHNMEHLCLRIAPVAEIELRAYLEREGVTTQDFAERYGATGYGRSIYINDPQGNVVELKLER